MLYNVPNGIYTKLTVLIVVFNVTLLHLFMVLLNYTISAKSLYWNYNKVCDILDFVKSYLYTLNLKTNTLVLSFLGG